MPTSSFGAPIFRPLAGGYSDNDLKTGNSLLASGSFMDFVASNPDDLS
jgi:hypothetical protein